MSELQTITIKGNQRVAYTVSGQGPAMVIMHGWGCDHTTVQSIERVASQTHTVYNLDLPGFGASDEPAEVWGVEEYCEMLEEFITALKIENPILLGHSFGGRVAILYSSRHSGISKIVLVDAAGVKPRRTLKYYCKIYSYKFMKKIMQLTLGKEKAEQRAEIIRKKRGSSDYAQASPRMRQILTKTVNQDLRYAMPSIKASALLIWGENDTATPIADAKTMERLIPDAGLVSFPGCGHYSFLDNPYQFAAVLKSFIN